MGDSSYKNHRPFRILAFSLQLLTENKEHIEGNIQYLGILIFEGVFDKSSHFPKEFKESFLYRGKVFEKSFPL